MSTIHSTPAIARATTSTRRSPWLPLARAASWSAIAGLIALNAWWWWDARPMPNMGLVERWIGTESEPTTRVVPWWDVWDVPRTNDGAIAVLRRAVRRSPNDGDARYLLGRALAARDDFRGCAEQLRMVPYWSLRKPEAQYFEAMSWLALKRIREAETALLAYLDVDPNHPTVRPRRVEVENKLLDFYAWEDRWEESRALIRKAYEDVGDQPLERRKLLEMSLRTRLERADAALTLPILREILAADPDDWEARRALARAANYTNHFEESDAASRRCLEERPKDPRAWADRLEFLEGRDDRAGLAAALKQVPSEAEVEDRVWMIRGRVLRQARDFRGAAKAFAKAVELAPFDPSAHHNLAQALQMTDRSAEAEPHRRLHADLLEVTKEVPDAVNAFKDATDVPSPKPELVKAAMLRIASACGKMGWADDAERWAKLAREM